MSDSVQDLVKFLQIGARLDLKAVAVAHLLGLTGTDPGVLALIQIPNALESLVSLLHDNSTAIAKDVVLCLVNISAVVKGAESLIDLCPRQLPLQKPPEKVVATALHFIFDKKSTLADPCCMILSNLSRPIHLVEKTIAQFEESGRTFDELISVFTKKQYNETGANLHYLGPVLSNLSQNPTVRKYILDRDRCVVQRLLPFTVYQESLVRRGGVIGTLKNCCFEYDAHEWLLGDDVDILPRLVLPLAGSEEFDDEDNEKLPLDLQFLPEDKERERDPDIRCILLESLTQLCAIRRNREFIREKNIYVILRELHKWEKDRAALLLCESLVNILIRTEDEIGEDNLNEVVVPEHLHDEFQAAEDLCLNSN